jgi:hypothetical protein
MNRGGISCKQADRIVEALRTTKQRIPDIAAIEQLSAKTIRKIALANGISSRGRM